MAKSKQKMVVARDDKPDRVTHGKAVGRRDLPAKCEATLVREGLFYVVQGVADVCAEGWEYRIHCSYLDAYAAGLRAQGYSVAVIDPPRAW